MIDSALQRLNMVESQIRPSDITDRRILRGMQTIPREQFVPAGLAQLAYMDDAVSLFDPAHRQIGPHRVMMSPRTLAKLLQIARIEPDSHALTVGCGRGYGAALLAQIASRVTALESNLELAAAAKTALAPKTNVTVVTGDLTLGCPEQGLYDVIVVEGAVSAAPATLLAQLKPGGRLVAIVATGAIGQATVWQRIGDTYGNTAAFEANVAILPGFEAAPAFAF
jgi:protein-L-isoaspartate(D-aspartate) O-methyltransferase